MRGLSVVMVLILGVSLPGPGNPSDEYRRFAQSTEPPLRIEGARVSTEEEAKELAIGAFFRKKGGKRALQTAKVVSINELDVEIRGFAKKGDKVWEVRILGLRGLSALIWVHSGTAKTLFLVPTD